MNHEWIQSSLGHCEAMCRWCGITALEAMALDKFNKDCPKREAQYDCGICCETFEPNELGDDGLCDDCREIRADLAENERLRKALRYMVNYYDEANPMRTADVHPEDCTCTRCVVDGFRAALDGEDEK